MNREDAFRFLEKYQPLPADSALTDGVFTQYDRVRKFFLENPDEASIPLFLNSFGEGDGLGAYQLIEDVLAKHSVQAVVPHLLGSLTSPYRSVRYWSAQIAAVFPDSRLVDPLAVLLLEVNDFDMRYAAVTALEQIEDAQILRVLRDALKRESDDEIRHLIQEVIA